MPTSPDLRTQLKAAAALLRNGGGPDPELAQTVEGLTAPYGWVPLRDTDIVQDSGASASVTLLMNKADKEQVVASAKAANNVLTHDVNEGWYLFLEGSFTPRPFQKARPGSGEEKESLIVRPSESLRKQINARNVRALASRVAVDYLLFKYQAGHYAATQTAPVRPRGDVRIPQVPRPIRNAVRSATGAQGRLVTDVIEVGFDRFLAGEFTPTAPVWPADADMVPMKVNPNNDLFDEVKAKAEGLTPMQIGLAYLLAEYGIDPSTAE